MAILAALEPSPFPVLSLYLNLTPNETGRDEYGQFLRKVFAEGYRHESGFDRTITAVRERDAETDAEKVRELLDEWRSGGLGVAGPEATLNAFQIGQVDELIITGSPDLLKPVQKLPEDAAPGTVEANTSAPQAAIDDARLKLAGELIARPAHVGADPLHRGRVTAGRRRRRRRAAPLPHLRTAHHEQGKQVQPGHLYAGRPFVAGRRGPRAHPAADRAAEVVACRHCQRAQREGRHVEVVVIGPALHRPRRKAPRSHASATSSWRRT
jgi:hypothetical protein